jgi:Protein of unknown function (DUF3352)
MRSMRMRLAVAAPLAALALLVAAGCGGSSKSKQSASGGTSGAEVIPASAVAFIGVNTDLGSNQWKQVDALSKKFPGRGKAIAQIEAQMAKDGVDFKRDVKPALGPEVDFAWLDFADNGTNVVAVTQPKDDAKFAALVKKANKSDPKGTQLVMEKVGDWTALSDSQAKLDRLKSAQNGAKLADDSTFKDAVADLPDETLVTAYLNGQAARQAIRSSLPSSNPAAKGVLAGTPLQSLQWISAAGTAESSGVRLAAGLKTTKGGKTYSAELVHALPAGAWAYISFHDLASGLRKALNAFKSTPGFQAQRTQLEQAFGFSLENDLLPIFAGEGALAVYPGAVGSEIPTVDFVLKVKDEAKARNVLNRLAALARLGNVGTVRTVRVGGVTATELRPTGLPVSIYFTLSKGMVVVTDSRSALASIGGSGKKLADDPPYKEARSSAKAPDDTLGFVYVNLHAVLPAAFGLAESTGSSSASLAEARANTKPLQSLFLYGTKDGDVTRLAGFLEIK